MFVRLRPRLSNIDVDGNSEQTDGADVHVDLLGAVIGHLANDLLVERLG